ncbi:MAG: GNAT family N-acetyltransferase [Verrucomicrobiota bacterium]|jgi:L-amino acid N-acyltransferase|nr:GNAT family N-acetyltransferase [Verrucomicrobiota bacterium]
MRRVKPSKRLVPHGAVWFLAGVSDEVIIRAAVREDVPGILLIYNAAVREPAAAYEDVPHTLAQREEWFDYFTGRNYPILVADTHGVIVGWGSLGPHQERMGFRFTGAVAVYVKERSRRQGIGGRLMEALLKAGRARQLHVLLATIDAANKPSLQLHARHGFTKAGMFSEAGCKFGEWRDVVYLQRKLDDRLAP